MFKKEQISFEGIASSMNIYQQPYALVNVRGVPIRLKVVLDLRSFKSEMILKFIGLKLVFSVHGLDGQVSTGGRDN